MEKKFKFSDNPTVAKSVYGAVIALLCITAIIVGIVAANNRKKNDIAENPPISDGQDQTPPDGENGGGEDEGKTLNFIAPVVGTVLKGHSTTVPAYSNTLEEWRIHTGIDISTDEGADVYAVEAGEVTAVFADPMHGYTVVIKHSPEISSRYSNLSKDTLPTVGQKVVRGEKIAVVGDSTLIELADETHLHFDMLVNEVSVNPLDYISEEAKKVSLGITDNEAA